MRYAVYRYTGSAAGIEGKFGPDGQHARGAIYSDQNLGRPNGVPLYCYLYSAYISVWDDSVLVRQTAESRNGVALLGSELRYRVYSNFNTRRTASASASGGTGRPRTLSLVGELVIRPESAAKPLNSNSLISQVQYSKGCFLRMKLFHCPLTTHTIFPNVFGTKSEDDLYSYQWVWNYDTSKKMNIGGAGATAAAALVAARSAAAADAKDVKSGGGGSGGGGGAAASIIDPLSTDSKSSVFTVGAAVDKLKLSASLIGPFMRSEYSLIPVSAFPARMTGTSAGPDHFEIGEPLLLVLTRDMGRIAYAQRPPTMLVQSISVVRTIGPVLVYQLMEDEPIDPLPSYNNLRRMGSPQNNKRGAFGTIQIPSSRIVRPPKGGGKSAIAKALANAGWDMNS